MTIHLYDLFTKEELSAGKSDGFISERANHDGLGILNYTDKAMYTTGAWDNPAVRICRGLIYNPTNMEVVARPWAKFFNLGQKEVGEIHGHDEVEVTDKCDGSLAIMFRNLKGELQVATRGSFVSDQAVWATRYIQNNQHLIGQWVDDFTPLFEIIYPENRVVLSYDFSALVLLGGVWISTGKYVGPAEAAETIQWAGRITKTFRRARSLQDALEIPPRPNAEGLVVRFLNSSLMVKIKQEDYLRAHRIITHCTPRHIWGQLMDGDTLSDLLVGIPDEFVDMVQGYHSDIMAEVTALSQRIEEAYSDILALLPKDFTRKEFAQHAAKFEHSKALFMKLDGKDIHEYCLKKVKPAPISIDLRKEDVA